MRHYAEFDAELVNCLKRKLRKAVEGTPADLDEDQFVSALIRVVKDIECETPSGYVKLGGSAFKFRGRGSPDFKYGIDFSITAEISNANDLLPVRKTILFQAKKGDISRLKGEGKENLEDQCRKMLGQQPGPKILEILEEAAIPKLRVISASGYLKGKHLQKPDFIDYMINKVLPTIDGDRRPKLYEKARNASFGSNLHLEAKILK
jgi:hypothetical protein